MTKKNNVCYFSVRSSDNRRGGLHRVWWNKKGDVFIAFRSIAGQLKTTLHISGQCHIGFTAQYFQQLIKTLINKFFNKHAKHQNPSRFWLKWQRKFVSDAHQSDYSHDFMVLTHTDQLRHFELGFEEERINWIDVPDGVEEIDVCFFTQIIDDSNESWPAKNIGAELLLKTPITSELNLIITAHISEKKVPTNIEDMKNIQKPEDMDEITECMRIFFVGRKGRLVYLMDYSADILCQ